MHPGLSRFAVTGFLCGLFGCQAVASRLGLGDEESSSTGTEARVDVGSQSDAETDAEPQKKKRRKRKRKTEPAPPPSAETELHAVLARAIIAVPEEPGLYRVDPFVLSLLADTLEHEDDIPFTRTTKRERKAGVPPSFRVGKLPKPSLWRRLGLRPGDLILSVEDAKPPGPKRLLALRKKVPREGTLSVRIQRNGKARTLRYRIEPGLAWTRYLEIEADRSFDQPPTERPSGGSSPSSPSRSGKLSPSKPSGGSKPVAAVPVTCSGSTCRMPKWYFDSLVGSSSKARQQMRGKSISSGYKVSFVGPASRKAGFRVGEVISKINGSRTNNQLAMLGLYGRLKRTKKFRVESTRGGRNRVTMVIVE